MNDKLEYLCATIETLPKGYSVESSGHKRDVYAGGIRTLCDNDDLQELVTYTRQMEAALKKISEPVGKFSRDDLTFAENVIEETVKTAQKAINAIKENTK